LRGRFFSIFDLIQNMYSLEACAGSSFIICSLQKRYVFGLLQVLKEPICVTRS